MSASLPASDTCSMIPTGRAVLGHARVAALGVLVEEMEGPDRQAAVRAAVEAIGLTMACLQRG